MSYYPAQAQLTITVVPPMAELTLTAPPPPWYVGQAYTLTVSYSSSATCLIPRISTWTATIYVQYSNGQTEQLAATGALECGQLRTSGTAVASWTPKYPGYVTMYAVALGLRSNTVTGQAVQPVTQVATQFANLSVYPSSTVAAGSQFQVRGVLETASGQPLAGQVVTATFLGQTYSATTGSDGSFSFTLTAPTQTGTYTVSLYFAGSQSAGLLPASATISVSVPQLQAPQLPAWAVALIVGGAAAALAAAGWALSRG